MYAMFFCEVAFFSIFAETPRPLAPPPLSMPTKSPPPLGESEPLVYVWNGRGVEPKSGRHAEKLQLLIEAIQRDLGVADATALRGWTLRMVARKLGER